MLNYYYQKRALWGLKRKYNLDVAVDRILRDWISECILHRKQEGRRKELTDTITAIKEKELFLKWLNSK